MGPRGARTADGGNPAATTAALQLVSEIRETVPMQTSPAGSLRRLWRRALTAVRALVGWLRREPALATPRPAGGQQVGPYRLEEPLGAGGMGEVWRARHVALGRPAAVKLIRAEALAGGGGGARRARHLTARFEREARATAALRSPHTIEVYDFGEADDGSVYYAMELLDGIDVRTLVKRFGPVPPARAVHLLQQVCCSLAEAHSRGLLHRDIKPSNVQVCRLGVEVDVVKVLDFGLVKDLFGGLMQGATITLDGVAPGTPAYMAPEAALGSAAVDARADLYSVGCLAYWMLTGRHVFDDDGEIPTRLRRVYEDPIPPSRFTHTDVPEALERIVLRCLARDQDDRYPDVAALLAALRSCDVGSWTPLQAQAWWVAHVPQETYDEAASGEESVRPQAGPAAPCAPVTAGRPRPTSAPPPRRDRRRRPPGRRRAP